MKSVEAANNGSSPNTLQKTSVQTLRSFFCNGNVDQNDASLERLDGVRILVNGWRLRKGIYF